MRVISGTLRGRNFDSPPGYKTHPMSEKIRGAIFNALGDIEQQTVLDAFAGTGALCFEAVSRGSAGCVAIDSDKSAHITLIKNIKSLGLVGDIKAIRANATSWSDNNPNDRFDLVFLDPPYDKVNISQLQKLSSHTAPSGVLVLSLPPEIRFVPNPEDFEELKQKAYGDATLAFYRRAS